MLKRYLVPFFVKRLCRKVEFHLRFSSQREVVVICYGTLILSLFLKTKEKN